MSIGTVHTICEGDSLDSLVRNYRLSSRQAILGISGNKGIRSLLQTRKPIEPGLTVHIPPNAAELARQRQYCLQSVRPLLLQHFDELQTVAAATLREALLRVPRPQESAAVGDALNELAAMVEAAVDSGANLATPLVGICIAMTGTHVADEQDEMASASKDDAYCGLYWAVSPASLDQWRAMWQRDFCNGHWAGVSDEAAWARTVQHLNTIRSLVIQRMDQRLREAYQLQQLLLRETD